MDEGESFSRRINVLSVPVRWTNQNEKTACCAHTPAAIFHHNENIILLASIDCKLFLADANWFGRCTSKCPPTHSSHTRLLFPANSYYILVRTIDKIISFPFSSERGPPTKAESTCRCWKQCFSAPTGIMNMNHELFSPLKATPQQLPIVGAGERKFQGKFIQFSLSVSRVFISVEFGNSIEKVLIFVADFGSTLFPFGFILFLQFS